MRNRHRFSVFLAFETRILGHTFYNRAEVHCRFGFAIAASLQPCQGQDLPDERVQIIDIRLHALDGVCLATTNKLKINIQTRQR